MLRVLSLMCVAGLAGCGPRQVSVPDEPAPTTWSKGTAPEPTATLAEAPARARPVLVSSEVPPQPPSAVAIRPLLAVRHKEDLPDRGQLDAVAEGPEGLIWHARWGDTVAHRGRALELLGLYPESAVRELLVEIAADSGELVAVRAGALWGLAGQDLTGDEDARATALAALESDDVRLVVGGVQALADVPEARPRLEALAADEEAPAAARDAAATALRD